MSKKKGKNSRKRNVMKQMHYAERFCRRQLEREPGVAETAYEMHEKFAADGEEWTAHCHLPLYVVDDCIIRCNYTLNQQHAHDKAFDALNDGDVTVIAPTDWH